ncbi:MAG: hypothetical protein RLO17_17845 [Cyclobacteriaceae bacterium]
MKKLNVLITGIFLSAGLFLSSCNDNDATPGKGNIYFGVITTSGTTGNAGSRVAAANDLVFTGGKITIREVVFDGDNGGQSVSRTIEQIAEINYATGAVTPEIVVEVPAGDYTSVNLGIEMQDDGDDPSTVLEGTYTNSNEESIPVRFEFNSGEVFEANASSVTIAEGADIVGKVTFDAIDWFSVISAEQLDNATLTEGVMVISSTSNTGIFDAVADRLDVATEATFE